MKGITELGKEGKKKVGWGGGGGECCGSTISFHCSLVIHSIIHSQPNHLLFVVYSEPYHQFVYHSLKSNSLAYFVP